MHPWGCTFSTHLRHLGFFLPLPSLICPASFWPQMRMTLRLQLAWLLRFRDISRIFFIPLLRVGLSMDWSPKPFPACCPVSSSGSSFLAADRLAPSERKEKGLEANQALKERQEVLDKLKKEAAQNRKEVKEALSLGNPLAIQLLVGPRSCCQSTLSHHHSTSSHSTLREDGCSVLMGISTTGGTQ